MRNKLRHHLTHNLGLKILALVFAAGLWFVVNNITDPVIRRPFSNIPVEIENADMITNEGKVYEILDNTDNISVTVRGKSSILNAITKDDIKAVVDMADLSFLNTVTIKVSCTRSNYNSQLEFIPSVENMKLSIEDVKRTQMVINVIMNGEPADGYIVGTVTPSQNVVRISGPESVIDQIDHVEALVEVRDTYTSDINTSVDLKLYDAEGNEIKRSGVTMNISTINIAVTILATKEVPVSFTVYGEPEENYLLTDELVSVPETVTIAGRKSVLDSVSEIVVADTSLTVDGATEDVTKIINIKKSLPSGTQFADSDFNGNVSVTVSVEPRENRDLEVPIRNFAIGNAPEEYETSILEFAESEARTHTIAVTGTAADVNRLEASTVIGVVDMNQMLTQLGLEAWEPGTYQGEITFNLPEGVTTQQVYHLTIEVAEPEEASQEEE